MFKEYQITPRRIDAVQFTEENKDQVFNSLTGNYTADFEDDKPILKVINADGGMEIVRLGNWIIKDAVIGTYYSLKNDVFIKNCIDINTPLHLVED